MWSIPSLSLALVLLATLLTPSEAGTRFNTTTVINSNCPCDRKRFKYCYYYTRRGIDDDVCYDIHKPSWSMRVYDPSVAHDDRLVCKVFAGRGCKGEESIAVGFEDNTRCAEPTFDPEDKEVYLPELDKTGQDPEYIPHAWWYTSFKCHHPGF